jgi:hypothetical protein
MPQTVTLFWDLGSGEKDKTKKQFPVSGRKLIFCCSTVSMTLGSSVLTAITGA